MTHTEQDAEGLLWCGTFMSWNNRSNWLNIRVYIIKIQSPCHAHFILKDHWSCKITETRGRNYEINKVDTTGLQIVNRWWIGCKNKTELLSNAWLRIRNTYCLPLCINKQKYGKMTSFAFCQTRCFPLAQNSWLTDLYICLHACC